ncbi:MAG TPA: pilus assembly protein TadG-related protein [Tepidiformaceae bacterium]|nr:pilus assembly protein TadG-related protein [Tepidiformaceae bacterium]
MLRRWFDPARRLQAADGQVLLLFAAGLVAFCGLVGMSVDVGHVVYTHTDLQKAADGAALAGAQDLNGTSASVATAEATADKYLVDNGYASASCRPNCASVDGTYTKITVSVAHTVDFYFLRAVGLSGSTPSATAVSQMYSKTVTGYDWNSVAPFTIWGGSRSNEVHAGDANCVLHTCVGKSYTFLDTGWMTANGSPTDPDWTANGSNNFKGDINHGAGSPIIQVGDSFQSSSNGGLGSVTAPDVGTTIVIPVMSKASGNSNNRTFTIGEWVLVKVDSDCSKQHCSGTVLGQTEAPAGAVTTGTVQPPSSTVSQFLTYGGLIG